MRAYFLVRSRYVRLVRRRRSERYLRTRRKPYRWANTPAVQAEMDEGVKIDGEFNDSVYENINWLDAVDRRTARKLR